MSSPTDELFRVLADPTRRRILDLLVDAGALTVGQLAAQFPGLVASGISKHLMALRGAGLVVATRQGRHQLYTVDADALAATISPWLARYEAFLASALTRLREAVVDAEHGGRPGRDSTMDAPTGGPGQRKLNRGGKTSTTTHAHTA